MYRDLDDFKCEEIMTKAIEKELQYILFEFFYKEDQISYKQYMKALKIIEQKYK